MIKTLIDEKHSQNRIPEYQYGVESFEETDVSEYDEYISESIIRIKMTLNELLGRKLFVFFCKIIL